MKQPSTKTITKNKNSPVPFLRLFVIFLTFSVLFLISQYSKKMKSNDEANYGKRAYSIWFEPATIQSIVHDEKSKSFAKKAQEFINERTLSGVTFAPHVTLLGPVYSADEREVVEKTEKLARMISSTTTSSSSQREEDKPKIRFMKADVGETYFQCVYLLADVTAFLMRAREKALDVFKARDARRYMPHLSLAYGDESKVDRIKLMIEANDEFRRGTLSSSDSEDEEEEFFVARSISLWKTDVGDTSCKSWVKVKEFPL